MGFGCKYDIGLIRNHYVGRTFISPGQKSREQKVRTKFNPVKGVIEGRSVIIVDDSIVRGTTSQYLVNMIRACNPAEIHFLRVLPPLLVLVIMGWTSLRQKNLLPIVLIVIL